MPELPEVRCLCMYVNNVCKGITFMGSPERSSVSKNPTISFTSSEYTITSEARGKEIALNLLSCSDPSISKRLLFRLGMSGKFRFTAANELTKHSHLIFYTTNDMALSYVDPRRFGSWLETDEWGPVRGPDPVMEHQLFVDRVLHGLHLDVFNKPICEVMLNQKYFNGIGNYLRSEILYRAKIPPFTAAREAILQQHTTESITKSDGKSTILYLCREVPMEVIQLKTGRIGIGAEDISVFMNWLQCYENQSMNNLVDHNGRTIWFDGDAGPLVPKVKKSRGRKRKKTASNESQQNEDDSAASENNSKRPKISHHREQKIKQHVKESNVKQLLQTDEVIGVLTRSQKKMLSIE